MERVGGDSYLAERGNEREGARASPPKSQEKKTSNEAHTWQASEAANPANVVLRRGDGRGTTARNARLRPEHGRWTPCSRGRGGWAHRNVIRDLLRGPLSHSLVLRVTHT